MASSRSVRSAPARHHRQRGPQRPHRGVHLLSAGRPDVHHLAQDSKFADVLDCNPDLESVIKLDLKGLKKRFTWDGVRAEYRKLTEAGDFDLVIDLHGMLKSALVARRLGGVRTGFHRSVVKEPLATFFYTKTFTIPLSDLAVNRYSALIDASLGVSPDPGMLTDKAPFLFHLPEHAAVTADYFRHDRKNIVLVPETSIDYKNYPKDKWVAVANAIPALKERADWVTPSSDGAGVVELIEKFFIRSAQEAHRE